jgi:phosphatidylserine/phosphatidylglycerophosphate/cardiolipin synthase-like enzyme
MMGMFGIVLVSFLFFAQQVPAEMSVQACFSPRGKCSGQVMREIAQAKKEVLVAVYAFTSEDLAAALAQARRRGVTVQVIIDRDFDERTDNSKARFLETHKIPLRRISGIKPSDSEADAGLMHQKFAVIDRANVLTGSYNWTRAAELFNHENLLLFRNAGPLAEEYRKIFFQLWNSKSL